MISGPRRITKTANPLIQASFFKNFLRVALIHISVNCSDSILIENVLKHQMFPRIIQPAPPWLLLLVMTVNKQPQQITCLLQTTCNCQNDDLTKSLIYSEAKKWARLPGTMSQSQYLRSVVASAAPR